MEYIEAGKALIKKINEFGYEAYFVGGAVRDNLLNIKINDIDITTNAPSEEIIKIFPGTDETGVKYHSVLVNYESYDFEITTYREDLSYFDNRHPLVVKAPSLDVDLKRRDFTVNAIATTDFINYVDNFKGIEDLNNKILRTIKDPNVSFVEDSLRMLRAVYFAGKLNFTIEEKTLEAMKSNASLVSKLSSQRKIREMEKVLKLSLEQQKVSFKYLLETGIAKELLVSDAVSALLNRNIKVDNTQIFYTLAFRELGYIPEDIYKFKRKFVNQVNKIIDVSIATENGDFNTLILYNNGEEICLYANIVNIILGLNEDLREKISSNYNSLPIKKTCDLVFKGQDVMELCNLDKVSEISVIVDMVKFEVLMGNLPNDYEILKDFVLKDSKKG